MRPDDLVGTVAAACEDLLKVYGGSGREVVALNGVGLQVPRASMTAIVGPSGSGKSSLLRILAGFDRPTAGRVLIGGVETTNLRPSNVRELRRRRIAYVFQRPADNLVAYVSVAGHLRQAARIRGRARGWRREADEILEVLGLSARSSHLPHQLSGGEQQRTAFAAAVIGSPDLVIADEPTGELDSRAGRALLGSVASLASRGTAFVVATHDPAVVDAAGRTYHLRHGSIEAESTTDRPLSVIDANGRVQLPPAWRELFPDRRAEIVVEDDGMRIVPP
jgi:putative ABC transport system ATP-binding protein